MLTKKKQGTTTNRKVSYLEFCNNLKEYSKYSNAVFSVEN